MLQQRGSKKQKLQAEHALDHLEQVARARFDHWDTDLDGFVVPSEYPEKDEL